MNTGTIIYVKQKKLFKNRVVFMGVAVCYSFKEFVYYFENGVMRVTAFQDICKKYENIETYAPFEVADSNKRMLTAKCLNSLLSAKFKYSKLEKLYIWLNGKFGLEFTLPKRILKTNKYIYRADIVAYMLRYVCPEKEITSTIGVKAEDLLCQK